MKSGKKGIKRFVIIAAVVVLGAGGFVGYPRLRAVWAGDEAGATYRVRSETYTDIIEIAGTVSAAKEQNLQAAGAGTVTAVYVREGDRVAKGQVVLRLDDSEQRYNLEKHDFDVAQKRVSGSPREIELLERQREVLEQRLKDRQVIANFDGVIAQLSIAVGDVVEAKDSAGVILDRSYLKATVEVVETDAPKLRPGQRATLSFPALAAAGEDTVVEGFVYSFPAVAAKSSRGASVVNAEIHIDNPPDVILPNYSFSGSIEIRPPETLLLVERLAIGRPTGAFLGSGVAEEDGGSPTGKERGEGDGGGQPPIHSMPPPSEAVLASKLVGPWAEKVLPGGGVERVAVRVEPYGDEFVKVLSGLAEGDEVKAQGVAPRSGQAGQSGAAADRASGPGGRSGRRGGPPPPIGG